jgi:hypothetical protein
VPPLTAFGDEETGHGGGVASGRFDADEAHGLELPRNLRLWN